MKHNGAMLLVDCLIKHDVKYVFGIPGAKVDAVYEALRLREDQIKLIVCRHEQNAAFMAAMFGRLTGKPGVVIVTSGPGVTNLTTGLLTATSEGDPVIAIGANVSRKMRLKQTHQSLDNASVMKPVSKSSVEVLVPDSIPEAIETAFRVSTMGKGGAAFISIPQDVLLEETALKANEPVADIELGAASILRMQEAAALFNQAKSPILLLGMQASQPKNAKAILDLLSHIKIPVVGTYQAAGVIPRDLLDCFVGRVGLFKNQPGDLALDAADLVVTIGYDPIEYDPEIWNKVGSNKEIIHIDQFPAEIHTVYIPTVELMGDIDKTIDAWKIQLHKRDVLSHLNYLHDLQKQLTDKIDSGKNLSGALIHPLRFIHDLKQCIDDDTTVISDIGSHYMWLARYFFSHKPHHLLFSNGQQTLGVALPWAIATRFIRPIHKIVSISGDGGFLFSAMELETAVREKLHFVHCVWRDGTYNMVLEQQLMKYQHGSGVNFGEVDIVKFAESFGAKGYRVKSCKELIPTLTTALQQEGPVLIEIPIDYRDNPELFAALHQNAVN